jgi:hypothetical protein
MVDVRFQLIGTAVSVTFNSIDEIARFNSEAAFGGAAAFHMIDYKKVTISISLFFG